MITDRDGRVIGSTGLNVETLYRAVTGYMLARETWGHGYATEVTKAMTDVAESLGIVRLAALCHPDNRASVRVLEKVGFILEGVLHRHTVFPNLESDQPLDVEIWARILTRS